MKVLNFGSLNYDNVYSVDHIVQQGETIFSTKLELFCGGKGLNQSVALARAGAEVCHAGMVGPDGERLRDACRENGIDCRYIRTVDRRTGHAVIQVSGAGQNSIVLFGGANRRNTKEFVDEVLADFGEGDLVLLQNEINLVDDIIDKAYEKKMQIALNPSPFDSSLSECDFRKVSVFLINEIEGAQITGKKEPEEMMKEMLRRYPNAKVVLTLGKAGVIYGDQAHRYAHGTYRVEVVDTTAAGDTFTGYFLASYLNGNTIPEALRVASVASSMAVSKMGAADSIPYREDVLKSRLEPVCG
ncbi:ribokinase [Caproiciproducens sp. R2]|uniref:ribokinase n=1 Tax=Caproiciproducens sp. R2 TaxID=3435187 RepID=UPI004034268E